MKSYRVSIGLAAGAAAALLLAGTARAQAAAPAAPTPGDRVVKLTNSAKTSISAVYVAPAGSVDASDDLLGKQVAGPGKTVTLKVKDPKASCVFDIQFLMNNGDIITKKAVNLCQSSDVTFTPGG